MGSVDCYALVEPEYIALVLGDRAPSLVTSKRASVCLFAASAASCSMIFLLRYFRCGCLSESWTKGKEDYLSTSQDRPAGGCEGVTGFAAGSFSRSRLEKNVHTAMSI